MFFIRLILFSYAQQCASYIYCSSAYENNTQFHGRLSETNDDNNNSSSATRTHIRSAQIAFIRRRHLHHNARAVLICIRLWSIK